MSDDTSCIQDPEVPEKEPVDFNNEGARSSGDIPGQQATSISADDSNRGFPLPKENVNTTPAHFQQNEPHEQSEDEQCRAAKERALELLRSADDMSDDGGEVIIVHAQNSVTAESDMGTVTAGFAKGEDSAFSPSEGQTGSHPAAVDRAPLCSEGDWPEDDSYIASLTDKALEVERQDVIRVPKS